MLVLVRFVMRAALPPLGLSTRIATLSMVSAATLVLTSLGSRTAAAIFAVNSTSDVVDASPGDGVCRTPNGTCTLRAAIQQANALPGPDVVTLPAGTYLLSIPGTGENPARVFLDAFRTRHVAFPLPTTRPPKNGAGELLTGRPPIARDP